MKLLGYYFAVISAFAVIITVYDKLASRAGLFRIPEKVLLAAGFFGGAAAMYTVMQIIRHKTKKKKFMITLPFFIALQILAFFIIKYCNFNISMVK